MVQTASGQRKQLTQNSSSSSRHFGFLLGCSFSTSLSCECHAFHHTAKNLPNGIKCERLFLTSFHWLVFPTFNEDNSPHDGPNPAENEYCSAELQQGGEEANAERPTAVAWAVLSLRAEDDAKGGNQGPCRAIAFVAYDHYLETSFFIVHCKG